MFGPLQDDVAGNVGGMTDSASQVLVCHLFDEIPKVWCSQKYRTMAQKCIAGYENIMHDIQERNGEPTHR